MTHHQPLEPQKQALVWTTNPGSTRADSNVGGYWIAWTEYPGWSMAGDPAERRWCNAYCVIDGKTRSIYAGKQERVKAWCQAHFDSQIPSSQPQGALAL